MGLFSSIGKLFGEQTGFGGNGDPNPHNFDIARKDYEDAIAAIKGVGEDANSKALRGGIEQAAIAQLKDLDQNAAGRKQNFMEDMSRGFSADTQNLARAKGGTGNLATALHNTGGMYDAQSRATARGLTDLSSQATSDIARLGGIQGDLYGQQMQKAGAQANVYTNKAGAQNAVAEANRQATIGSEAAGAQRRGGTLKSISNAVGSFFSARGGMPKEVGFSFGGSLGGGLGSDVGGEVGQEDALAKAAKAFLARGSEPKQQEQPQQIAPPKYNFYGGSQDENGGNAILSPLLPKKKSGGGMGDMGQLAQLAPMAAMVASKGGMVPGEAEVEGDSEENDKIPAWYSPGEIVLPRSVTMSRNPEKNAAKFVKETLAGKHRQKLRYEEEDDMEEDDDSMECAAMNMLKGKR